MKNNTPQSKTVTNNPQAVYQKVSSYDVSQCSLQFYKNEMKSLYTRKVEHAVKQCLRSLRDHRLHETINTAVLFEQITSDILETKYKNITRAENNGSVNATGYDISDHVAGIYAEMKSSTTSRRGGVKSPKLSAMITNMSNKFCTVIVLVVDPYLMGPTKYRLYAIPPEAIPSDTSAQIDIPHHRLIRTDKAMIYEEVPKIGGPYAKYRINSLSDLFLVEDRLKHINLKRLAKVIRELDASNQNSETQENEIIQFKELFAKCIKEGNSLRKSKSNTDAKLPTDYNNPMYDIENNLGTRIFFDGKRINIIETNKADTETPVITVANDQTHTIEHNEVTRMLVDEKCNITTETDKGQNVII